MQSISSICRRTLWFCCSYFLVCSVAVGQDDRTYSPTDPNLIGVEKSAGHKGAAPNYVIVDLPEKQLLHYYPELKSLVQAQSQQDLTDLHKRVGANEIQLLNSVPGICADEDVVQEQLDKHGWVRGLPVFTGHYNYIVRSHSAGEGARLTEGRSDKNWQAIDPHVASGYSLVQDFALLPLHFHPLNQDAANFRYLGRQVLNNRDDYVVAFAQQPQKAELLGTVRVNGVDVVVAYQGIAWIDPENFQIARMRIDLLKARPDVGAETTETQFSEVRVPIVAKSFWLPSEAVVTRSAKDGALREKHQFSDYRVFVQQKAVPAAPPGAEKPK